MSGAEDAPSGYRRPPKAHRFGVGRSGNPKGRPAGSKNTRTLVQQIAHERQVVQENGRPVTLTNLALVFRTLQQKALSGDVPAIKLLDRYRARLGRAVDEEPQTIFILPERDTADIVERRREAERARADYQRTSKEGEK